MADDLFDGVQILNPRELNLRKQEGNTESRIDIINVNIITPNDISIGM